MRAFRASAAAVALWVGLTASASSAAVTAVPTGDSCVANGSGTAYTITINVGQSSPAQYGYAVGARGGTVTSLQGAGGTASTTNLPANTTTAVLLNSTAGVPGASVSLSVKTSRPIASSFVVVPWDQTHGTWFAPLTCAVSRIAATPSSTFTLQNTFTYVPASAGWAVYATLPGSGRVEVAQNGGTKVWIANSRASVSRAGKTKLMVHTTAAGRKALTASGSLKVNLSFEFEPTNGKPGTRTLTVTLRK
jgi:hypothetical protein